MTSSTGLSVLLSRLLHCGTGGGCTIFSSAGLGDGPFFSPAGFGDWPFFFPQELGDWPFLLPPEIITCAVLVASEFMLSSSVLLVLFARVWNLASEAGDFLFELEVGVFGSGVDVGLLVVDLGVLLHSLELTGALPRLFFSSSGLHWRVLVFSYYFLQKWL